MRECIYKRKMGYNPYIAEIEETHRRQEKREARRREDEREKFNALRATPLG